MENSKLHIRKGDTVKVIAGDSRNSTGKVLSVSKKTNRAIIEGVNIVSKHIKPSAANPNGGIVKKEAPIHISNLAVINPSNGEPTKIGRKLDANNKLQRYSKKNGEVIKNG